MSAVPAFVTVMERSTSRRVERLVLLAIASFADPDGSNCFPSLEGIAERANMSARSVQRAIQRLRAEGELIVLARRGGRGRNLYVIPVLDSGDREDAGEDEWHADDDGWEVGDDATSAVAPEVVDATAVVAPPTPHAPTDVASFGELLFQGRQVCPADATPAAADTTSRADRGDSCWRTTIQDPPRDHPGPSNARGTESGRAEREQDLEPEPTAAEQLAALGCDPGHQTSAEVLRFGEHEARWALGMASGTQWRGVGAATYAATYLREKARGTQTWTAAAAAESAASRATDGEAA